MTKRSAVPAPSSAGIALSGAAGITPTDCRIEQGDNKATVLAQWWRDRAESEISQTVAKATEYSGLQGGLPQDLVDLGRQVAFVQHREHHFSDAELAEIGCWVYLQGKLNRWSSAIRNGRMVSDDTLLDIGVYVRICQHIRETGEWP